MNKYKPFGSNILIKPVSKDKVIGDTAKYYLFGEVIDIGDEVKNIKVGDTIGYTLWGLKEILEADGTKHFFVKEDPAFILGILQK